MVRVADGARVFVAAAFALIASACAFFSSLPNLGGVLARSDSHPIAWRVGDRAGVCEGRTREEAPDAAAVAVSVRGVARVGVCITVATGDPLTPTLDAMRVTDRGRPRDLGVAGIELEATLGETAAEGEADAGDASAALLLLMMCMLLRFFFAELEGMLLTSGRSNEYGSATFF